MTDSPPSATRWRPFRRAGVTVTAEQLTHEFPWTTASGAAMHGEPGHWKLWEPDSPEKVWTITDEDFRATYEPADEGLFRSHGRVLARRAEPDEVIESKEGTTEAQHGDWVVQRAGHRWLVSADEFVRRYRPDPDETD